MHGSRILPATLLVAAAALSACHKKPALAPAPVPAPIDSTAIKQRIADSVAAANRAREAADAAAAAKARADSIARAAAEAATQASMRASLTKPIHFDFNKFDLRPEDQAILDAKLPILLANPGLTIQVAGNTDERGSTEYNLALGQRRAATAKRYLTDHGVADSRVETVSYGEERPLCTEHEESCWSQNRRDEFTITAGGTGMLNKPGS
ncbi:MAG: peptidoglycan-associated lipoprotein [Gemmatimonadetes bacterium 21-71-4]|nr:MAG: peptidoglycan-associated lipoprotein [Gemmatimonadetes bacterium 21-71-4]